MDDSRSIAGAPATDNAYAIATDEYAADWKRLDRDNEFYPNPCTPPSPAFVDGFGRGGEDICRDDACDENDECISQWDSSSDPSTASGWDPVEEEGYLYFTGGFPTFAYLRLDPATAAPLSQWRATRVPHTTGAVDKPFVSSDPEGNSVYIHWTRLADPEEVFMAFSCSNGLEFFHDEPTGCDDFDPFPGTDVRLSYLAPESGVYFPPLTWGTASAVGPAPAPTASNPDPRGDVHFIWPLRDDDGLDQIYRRSLRWDDDGQPFFDPPLPEGDDCTPEETCERAIIHDQPGITGDGYDGTHIGRVRDSFNILTITHPSIAVDRSDPADGCNFSGYIYVAYAAEEPDKDYDPPYQDYEFVDSNIYVVRSRDYGETWSEPLRLYGIEGDEYFMEEACSAPICPEGGGQKSFRRPVQFYPWIAVDKQGRVGIMWHDTSPDYADGHARSNACDGNVIYDVRFAYSLDGGIHWQSHVISLEESQTGVGEDWGVTECRDGIRLGEYSGLTATSNDEGEGKFHAIWTDLRGYTKAWHAEEGGRQGAMGDIYTARIIVDDAVYSLGDWDRDYDVDMDDFEHFGFCTASTLPAECEILDMNRNNMIDNADMTFFIDCLTGPAPGGGESATGGEGLGGEDGMTPLQATVNWCLSTMSYDERATLAGALRDAAQSFDSEEAARMVTFAGAIDPLE